MSWSGRPGEEENDNIRFNGRLNKANQLLVPIGFVCECQNNNRRMSMSNKMLLSSRMPAKVGPWNLPAEAVAISLVFMLLRGCSLFSCQQILMAGAPQPQIGAPVPPMSVNPSVPLLGFLVGPPPPPAPGSDEVCGLNMKELRHERIVGGRSASYAEVPFIIHLRESHLFRVLGYNKCGGVLINHRWALTAAHCKPAFFSSLEIILGKHKTFEDAPPPEGSAMAAIVKMTGKSSIFASSSAPENSLNEIDNDWRKNPVMQVLADTVIVHPDYDSKLLENDLALVKLKKPVPFREDIQPICLPAFNEDFTSLDGYATGWGLTDFEKRQLPDTLQIVRLPIISNKRCQSMYKRAGHDKVITEMDLCAGYAKGGMDACEGDSGGPLIVRRPNDNRWVLAGIVSNGVKCGEPLLPGVYTRVSRFVPWIMEQMRIHS